MPLSYVEFLRVKGFDNLDTVDVFNSYNSYVKEWYKNAKTTKNANTKEYLEQQKGIRKSYGYFTEKDRQ